MKLCEKKVYVIIPGLQNWKFNFFFSLFFSSTANCFNIGKRSNNSFDISRRSTSNTIGSSRKSSHGIHSRRMVSWLQVPSYSNCGLPKKYFQLGPSQEIYRPEITWRSVDNEARALVERAMEGGWLDDVAERLFPRLVGLIWLFFAQPLPILYSLIIRVCEKSTTEYKNPFTSGFLVFPQMLLRSLLWHEWSLTGTSSCKL